MTNKEDALELDLARAEVIADERRQYAESLVKNNDDGSPQSLPKKKKKEKTQDNNGAIYSIKDHLNIGGYCKNLLSVSKSMMTGTHYLSDIQRIRLEFKLDFNDSLQAKVIYDNEAILGDFLHTPEFDIAREINQSKLAFVDLDKAYVDRDDFYLKHSLYRAYLKYYTPKFQCTVGKQLVDWGRCRFWSPWDLFNPISPLALEREERLGVDALDMNFSLADSLPQINFVYAPRDTFKKSSLGAKLYKQIGDYDAFLMAGEFREDEVIGACLDGYIGDWGVRGETTYTFTHNRDNFFRSVIGAEYHFSKLDILGEYFYNGGADDSDFSSFSGSYEYSSKILTLKEHLLGLQIGYEITPLLKFYNYTIGDIEGMSIFINPELKYNVVTNLDLSTGVQLFWGDNDSEFGNYEHVYYTQMQYFF